MVERNILRRLYIKIIAATMAAISLCVAASWDNHQNAVLYGSCSSTKSSYNGNIIKDKSANFEYRNWHTRFALFFVST